MRRSRSRPSNVGSPQPYNGTQRRIGLREHCAEPIETQLATQMRSRPTFVGCAHAIDDPAETRMRQAAAAC